MLLVVVVDHGPVEVGDDEEARPLGEGARDGGGGCLVVVGRGGSHGDDGGGGGGRRSRDSSLRSCGRDDDERSAFLASPGTGRGRRRQLEPRRGGEGSQRGRGQTERECV